jgi:tetratricopeptide (TPR) repeat protein
MKPPIGEIVRGALILIASIVGLTWLVVRTVKNAEDPARMIFKWVITIPFIVLCVFYSKALGVYGPVLIAFAGVILSMLWTPHLGAALVKPLTSLFDGGDVEIEPRPMYSIAQSRQKQGQYHEAVAAIHKQLERFPTDFEGHMMLAQIQAENLTDLPAAALTIQRLCNQPGHTQKNIAFALYSMADWHLKVGQDAEAARQNLQEIIDRFPDTEFALGAAQRIAHLGSPDMLLAPHDRRKFTVVEGPQNLGLQRARQQLPSADSEPAKLALEYVKHLELHPQDTEIREKLASIYVDHYGRLDMATDQMEQMIQQPNQPGKLVVRWLNLLADFQIRSGATYETVRETLERIIDLYPNLAAAEIARSRISLLRIELKAKEKPEAVKLGTYEQNIGLKQGGGPRYPSK